MKVAITGGTGLVGSALAEALNARGDQAIVVSRTAGPGRLTWDVAEGFAPPDALSGADAVVHLAGAGVADARWTDARKASIRDSRMRGTATVVQALRDAKPRPKVLISASAIGYYGDAGATVLREASPPGSDFLAEVCQGWERQAHGATALGVRLVTTRIGLVLSARGGLLERMLTPFKLGLGGRLGNGEHYMSWIHVRDIVSAFLHLLDSPEADGVFNLTAPNPVTNRAFTRALGEVLRRPTVLPVPMFALRLAFGELAEALVASQRVVPQRLSETGFSFAHPELVGALRNLLRR